MIMPIPSGRCLIAKPNVESSDSQSFVIISNLVAPEKRHQVGDVAGLCTSIV